MSDKHELSIGPPYPEEVEELGVDTGLHDANEAAHRVARAALAHRNWGFLLSAFYSQGRFRRAQVNRFIRARGKAIKARKRLDLALSEYERIVKEGDG